MLAAAAFFVGSGLSGWLHTPPGPPSRAYWWVVALFVAAAGGWLIVGVFRITSRKVPRAVWTSVGLVFLVVAAAGGRAFTDRGPIEWAYYTPQRFEQAQHEDQVVVMDFTAEWCLNCKVLEQSVLYDPRVVEALQQPGVVPMKVDITGNNAEGNRMLRQVDRLTIPLLVVFTPDGKEAFKSDFYTVDQVVSAIKAAQQRKQVAAHKNR